MKTMNFLSLRATAWAMLALLLALPAKAQMSDNGYAMVDWQYNFPLGNHFAGNSGGRGMNFEGGYFLTEHFALGAFITCHSNRGYIPRQTIPVGAQGSLNTDRQHTMLQLPFGTSARYVWNRGGAIQPYWSVKLGAEYARLKSLFNVFGAHDNTWGFYVSPEVGFTFYPQAYGPGLHIAAYYSRGTNKGEILTIGVNGLNNFGLRAGIAF